jgi:hypothetical protein
MLECIKKALESALGKGIYDLINYLLVFALGGISGLITHSISINNKYLMDYAPIITITSVILVALLALVIYKKVSPLHNFYLDTDFDYIFLEKKLTYEYNSPEDITYTKKYKILLRKSTDRFHDKYNWTGDNNPIITSSDSHNKIFSTTRRDSYQQFEVCFGKKYKKGEIIDLTLIFKLTDKEMKASTSFSTTIVEPTKKLTLTIKINKKYRTDSAIYEKFPSTDSRIALETKEYHFPDNSEIEVTIDDPKMLLVYSLNWENPNIK